VTPAGLELPTASLARKSKLAIPEKPGEGLNDALLVKGLKITVPLTGLRTLIVRGSPSASVARFSNEIVVSNSV
jgi:hypothetical protein